MITDFLEWFAEFGTSATAVAIMFANAVGESIIFPVPCDVVLIALATLAPHNSLWYAALTVVGSVSGAAVGYWIGLRGGRRILSRFFSEDKIAKLDSYFERYGVWAIFVAGFTPIPYKVFTISSGVARYNFTSFILISLLSRGLRFMGIGVLFYFFGSQIKEWLSEYLAPISWGALIAAVIAFLIYVFVFRKNNRRQNNRTD